MNVIMCSFSEFTDVIKRKKRELSFGWFFINLQSIWKAMLYVYIYICIHYIHIYIYIIYNYILH